MSQLTITSAIVLPTSKDEPAPTMCLDEDAPTHHIPEATYVFEDWPDPILMQPIIDDLAEGWAIPQETLPDNAHPFPAAVLAETRLNAAKQLRDLLERHNRP